MIRVADGSAVRVRNAEVRYDDGVGALEAFWRDVTFAARLLIRNRGFTVAATSALAL